MHLLADRLGRARFGRRAAHARQTDALVHLLGVARPLQQLRVRARGAEVFALVEFTRARLVAFLSQIERRHRRGEVHSCEGRALGRREGKARGHRRVRRMLMLGWCALFEAGNQGGGKLARARGDRNFEGERLGFVVQGGGLARARDGGVARADAAGKEGRRGGAKGPGVWAKWPG